MKSFLIILLVIITTGCSHLKNNAGEAEALENNQSKIIKTCKKVPRHKKMITLCRPVELS